ncbi:putative polysaccharide biosynthesis protein [Weissella bombi]|uniref:Membrane protein involved in the export of O-antigen and teichoic acid n=1 Tax=Weissella bombi TaxID=1505725 RepID=A0A1C4BDY5_9LACO|nr:polysaccharide biosynthesis protein [Weissella bombi]SCC04908.1 Membrane protein involved in the export of O-antigen and teichoic acid [Weissella bombi]
MNDDKSPQTNSPFRRDITFDELNQIINGKKVDEVFDDRHNEATSSEVTKPEESASTGDAKIKVHKNGVATFKVHEVPDTVTSNSVPSFAYRELPKKPTEKIVETPLTQDSEEYQDEPIEPPVETDKDAKSRMLRGSAWMTIGSLASRLLGALYIIPWIAMIGNVYYNLANSLFSQGYQIYSVALLIATAGLPNVLARLVAEYSASRQYEAIRHIFRQALNLGAILGIVAGAVLYLLAGLLSQGDPNVVRVIRALSAAVVIIPILSMLRGYVQGFEFMGLSAWSQFIEQLVRVVYMLAMTYWIMVGHHGDWVDATVQSTFAAFWGALAGIVILLFGILRRRRFFNEKRRQGVPVKKFDARAILIRMARQSVPVIFAGSAISLIQVFDQYTFFRIIRAFTNISSDVMQAMYAQFAFNSNKLVMLVVSLAVGMSETALPMISRAREIGDRENIGHQIQFAFKLLAFVMVPAVLGMVAVARPLYILFYQTNDVTNGTLILQFASYSAIFLSLYMVVLAIYQGLGQLSYTVRLLVLIFVIKFVLQIPLTIWLRGMGPLLATTIAFLVGMVIAIYHLSSQYHIDWSSFNATFVIILFWSLIMYAVVAPITYTLGLFVADTKLMQLLLLIIAGVIGVAIYGVTVLKTHVGEEILGARAVKLAHKLHLK